MSSLNSPVDSLTQSAQEIPSWAIQVNAEIFKQYTTLMGTFFQENLDWLTRITESCYMPNIPKNVYLFQIFHLVGMKLATNMQEDYNNLYYIWNQRLIQVLTTLNLLLTSKPDITEAECLERCESIFEWDKDANEFKILYTEVISAIYRHFPESSK